jgi:hypothetical protein
MGTELTEIELVLNDPGYGERIPAIGVLGQPLVAERRQAGGIDRLWNDVTVTECPRNREHHTAQEHAGSHQRSCRVHVRPPFAPAREARARRHVCHHERKQNIAALSNQ